MYSEVHIGFYNPLLFIGLEDIRNAWYIPPGAAPVKLQTIIHQGSLAYRFPVSGKRISYRKLKKGLIKKTITLRFPLHLLPF